MKKIKNSLWNRIFHHKALKEYQEWKKVAESIIGWNNQLNEDLQRAKSLQDLIDIHKHAWEIGYQNPNLGPCPWGIFRCESILELTLDNLYLGNIWGLWTNTGRYWEQHRSETMGVNGFGIKEYTLIYALIMQQYKRILKSNINAISEQTKESLFCK